MRFGGRMQFFQAGRQVFSDEKAIFTPLFFFFHTGTGGVSKKLYNVLTLFLFSLLDALLI